MAKLKLYFKIPNENYEQGCTNPFSETVWLRFAIIEEKSPNGYYIRNQKSFTEQSEIMNTIKIN